jgi:hypothetical protein
MTETCSSEGEVHEIRVMCKQEFLGRTNVPTFLTQDYSKVLGRHVYHRT